MNNKLRLFLPLLGLSLLGGLALWTTRAGSADTPAKAPTQTASAATTAAPAPATPSSAPSAASSAHTPQSPAPAARPTPPKSDIWIKLASAKVLESQDRPTPDGKIVRTTLIDYPGKYTRILVRETIVADAQNRQTIVEQVAMVADHMMVQRAKGTAAAEFESTLAQAGLSILAPMTTEGLYLVTVGPAGIDSLDQALGKLARTDPVAFAEPDFLVTTSDIESERHVIVQGPNGVLIEPAAARVFTPNAPADTSSFTPNSEFVQQDVQKRLDFMPAGSRILTFDSPAFPYGAGGYWPYLVEQNFKISHDATLQSDRYVMIGNASNASYPNNGTYHAAVNIDAKFDFTVQHAESVPFTALSVDLAEYSTSYATPQTIIFTGYKAAGGTVTQTFVTDGVIDGTGPQADFQTFTFNASFTGLAKLVANSTPPRYRMDNIAVRLEGAESSLVPPPPEPVLYQVTFDAPKHALNQNPEVSGPYAPSSVNFGSPKVRSAVGTMTGPALEFIGGTGNGSFGSGYQQIQFNLGRNAQLYRMEFDAYLDQPDEFKLIIDSTTGAVVSEVTFAAGSFPVRTVFSVRFDIDMSTRATRLFINGVDGGSYGIIPAGVDLRDFRLHLTGANAVTRVGIDNIRVTASGTMASVAGPVLSVPGTLSYPATLVGSTNRAYLNLANTGGQTLSVTSINSSNASFQVIESFPISILPGGTYAAKVDFTPSSSGIHNGTLTIGSNDPSSSTKGVLVTGPGSLVATVSMNPASLNLSRTEGTTSTANVTVNNGGAGTLLWTLVPNYTKPAPGPAPHTPVTPSDPHYSLLYGLKDPAVTSGGIDATHAWAITTGSATVKVAVIDTGVVPTHPDLAANIDTANGWNFITNTNNPMDDNGHGTHVSGTIAALGNNGLGVVGVTWNCKIVPLKFLDASGNGFTSDATNAVNYAAVRNIRITNNSWGGGGYSQSLRDAILNSGALFVAAAGNDGTNNDVSPHYPSNFDCNNILAVAATNSADTLPNFSQYGATTVDLAAPGDSIASTYSSNGYAYMSGTSMATPHVSGAAALLLSRDAALVPLQMKQLLMTGTDPRPALSGKMVTGGRLNIYASLRSTYSSWISAPVSNGTLAGGQAQPLALSVTTVGLAPGQYTQAFYLDSNDPANAHVLFPVTLQVTSVIELSITLSPAGGQWCVDGGAWQASGATVSGLTAGSHTVSYNTLAGHTAPSTETLTLLAGQALSLSRTYAPIPAQLTVTLTPGTGQWRVDGGAWQASGATATGLAAGSHTVEYNSLAGYSSPVTETVTLTAGQFLSLSRNYTILPAQLTITLTPTTGQWRVDGGAWQASGATVTGLTAGNHTVEYNSLAGQISPPTETVALTAGQSLSLSRSYTSSGQPAQLAITLTPASGKWRIDGGAWRNSGVTVTGLLSGPHTVDYYVLLNYAAPATETITLAAGANTLSRSYTQLAQLTVTLTPASGRWRVDGGAWRNSGITASDLTPGAHAIEYLTVLNYTTPSTETVTLVAGANTLSRNYAPLAQLTVNLTPATTGRWRLDGGSWRGTGFTISNLPLGSHLLEYNDTAGTTALPPETITLAAGAVTLTRTLLPLGATAQLTITLTPGTGQWRVDGGAWQASGATVTSLSASSHTVDYNSLAGYTAPPTESVTLTAGQSLSLSRSYTALPAQLTLTLTPGTAQWRVDGGAWQASGATATGLAAGSHTVDYNSLAGYTAPATETVTLTAGQSLSLSRSYVALPAQVTITLAPTSGQWRVDGGAWRASGATVTGLSVGSHTVDYNGLAGYTAPATETVTLTAGQSLSLSRSYTALPAQLAVTLTPAAGQWRVDGGAWQASGATVSGLVPGSHTVDYSPLSGYITPASETILLAPAESRSLATTYVVQPAELQVTLNPASGQWRLDGGAWRASGVTLGDLAAGSHTLEFLPIPDYGTPAPESVLLTPGQTLAITRTYVFPGQLTVNLNLPGAQWRLDDGAWRAAGATATSVAAGNHTIAYSAVPGYQSPPPEGLTMLPGDTMTISRSYTAFVPLTITLSPATGRWRADGGAWQASGATLSLLAGNRSIEYETILKHATPPSETVTLGDGVPVSLTRTYVPYPVQDYATTDLGVIGLSSTSATAVNLYGHVVGTLSGSGPSRAFLYRDGTIQMLPLPLGSTDDSYAADINDGDVIVGSIKNGLTSVSRIFRYHDGVTEDLGVFGSDSYARATAINNAGTIVGFSSPGVFTPPAKAFKIENGPMQLLGTLGGTESWAYGINDAGTIVGGSRIPPGGGGGSPVHAARYQGGAVEDLGALSQTADAYGVNASGVIVGTSYTLSGYDHAFRYLGGSIQDLGVLNGVESDAYAINAAGMIVGSIQRSNAHDYAMVTFSDGTMADLNTLVSLPGISLSRASDINELGQIVVGADNGHSYLLTPQNSPGGLQVNLTPTGGQWRVDGGAWQAGGAHVLNLAIGNHTVDYNNLSGYTTPTTETVTVASGRLLQLSRTYTVSPAQLAITLTPGTGQWRVDAGAWQASGATVTGLTAGSHTVEYNALAGYTAPATETVALIAGQSLSLSRSYAVLPAQLTLTLTPASGTQWRVDAGVWQASGATVTGLTAGNHTVEYNTLAGYTPPATETVALAAGQSLSLSRSYTVQTGQPAQLTITLTPATGKWRIDGGAWRYGGTTATGLLSGSHTLEYIAVASYATPATETVTLIAGANSLSRSYAQLSQLTVTLTPASGRWRIDSGAWRNSGTTAIDLTPGAHAIEYLTVANYTTPANETVTLAVGANTLSRSYAALAQLTVNLTPATGRWRLDGGAWRGTGFTISNLPLGSHLLEYNDTAGTTALPPETITLAAGAVTLTRTMVP